MVAPCLPWLTSCPGRTLSHQFHPPWPHRVPPHRASDSNKTQPIILFPCCRFYQGAFALYWIPLSTIWLYDWTSTCLFKSQNNYNILSTPPNFKSGLMIDFSPGKWTNIHRTNRHESRFWLYTVRRERLGRMNFEETSAVSRKRCWCLANARQQKVSSPSSSL